MTTPTQETSQDVQLPIQEARPVVPDHDPASAETPQDEPRVNREARYRVERNEARTALAETQARLTELRTWELERLAGEYLAQPEDLLSIGGHGLADFLTPEGWVDHDAVADAAAALIDSRPGLARNPKVRAVDRSQGSGTGSAPVAPTDFSGFLNNI